MSDAQAPTIPADFGGDYPHSGAIEALASMVTDSDDYTDTLRWLRQLLSERDWIEVVLQSEACPVHVCDIRICIDDEVAECRVYQ